MENGPREVTARTASDRLREFKREAAIPREKSRILELLDGPLYTDTGSEADKYREGAVENR